MKRNQNSITESMRCILIDWIIDIHLKFKLKNETLFIAVNLIDNYLALTENVDRKQLQLIGIACMQIASKYEEIYPPNSNEFIYITDYAYTQGQLYEMEFNILFALDFEIGFTTSYRFLERYKKVMGLDIVTFSIS